MTVILCDTSPLVALINRKDNNHARAVTVLKTLCGTLVTTWPCVAEAMHLLSNYGGWLAQEELWGYLEDGLVEIHESSQEARARMRKRMEQYRSTPMDLGDASLVAVAEALSVSQIFTFDTDFYVYQIGGNKPFDVVPLLF
jgi:predicted nucleic acid-binding protein